MKSYGWTRHNGVDFGEQDILDKKFGLNLTTSFIKRSNDRFGGEWTARITGNSPSPRIYSLYFYFGAEKTKDTEFLELPIKGSKGIDSMVLDGNGEELGRYKVFVTPSETTNDFDYSPKDSSILSSQDLSKVLYEGFHAKEGEDDLWNVREKVLGSLRRNHQKLYSNFVTKQQSSSQKKKEQEEEPAAFSTLSNQIEKNSNLFVFQKVVTTPFQFDIVFKTVDANEPRKDRNIEVPEDALTGQIYDDALSLHRKQFDDKFEETFELGKKGVNDAQQRFARETFSNLIGGIGYFYGRDIVKRKGKEAKEMGQEGSLFTAVPSRPFFPRGFLWDEGFHQLLVSSWDRDISMDILRHWFNRMDSQGWIAREQILGKEARSKVPEQFQTQFDDYANPPTLLFVLQRLQRMTVVKEGMEKEVAFLGEVLPKVQKWMRWFNRTQTGKIANTFRWRGRTENHTLTSGLDDYPRAFPSDDELHLDLISWMAVANRLMANMSSTAGKDPTRYEETYSKLLKVIEDVHWDESKGVYGDYIASDMNPRHETHVGYISIFPFLLGLIPTDSPRLGKILEIISDPNQLWSSYGILSLSKKDPFFGKDENYWRGPVWMNINYLVLSSLQNHYINVPGDDSQNPHREKAKKVYTKLRSNLIANVYEVWRRSGFVWEQYNPHNGDGKGSHPFTGWTALIVNIMGERY
eukprot:TRINITY_DN1427_c0_g3_i1.p1 TRINITY_DN1427_c0_g3~~TRINITY_DN1427_c0_g3_i1.p1  ORF type:complete len:801 (+),score=229.64 TRINITY_DN1427_c0_g3_i1:331-2403(+)